MSTNYLQPKSVFVQLCSLVGKWSDGSNKVTVEFRKSANDSILVETWTWPEKQMEALTIYYLDGGDLFATHYCPLGNQPNLRYKPGDNENRLEFHFVSATNLPDPLVDHCESFWFEIDSVNNFTRSETYFENETADAKQSRYFRVGE